MLKEELIMQTINNIEQDAEKAWEKVWRSQVPTGTTPTHRNLYKYQILDVEANPRKVNFEVSPRLIRSAYQSIRNNSSVPQSQTVVFNEKTTDTVTSSVTHGVKAGVSLKASAKWKASILVGSIEQSIEMSVSTEYNFSSTSTQTTSKERGWSISQPIIAPPFSEVKATLLIYQGDFEVPMDLQMRIVGEKGVSSNHPNIGFLYSAIFQKTGSSFARALISPSELALTSSAYRSSGYDAIWRGTANSRISQGLYSIVQIDETPLAGYPGKTRRYYLPIKPAAGANQILTPGSLGNEISMINPVPNAENPPVIPHHNRGETCEYYYDEVQLRHNSREKCERDYNEK